MSNTPSITPAEIAVVSAAVVVLYVVPFAWARIDERRRRRLGVRSGTVTETQPLDQAAAATPAADMPSAVAHEAPECGDTEAASAEAPAAPTAHESGTIAPVTEAPEPPVSIAANECAPNAPEPRIVNATLPGSGRGTPAFEPFAGDAGYPFRLEDLHRVRLVDCADVTGSQVGRDAERIVEAHREAIFSSALLSPYPIRSACRSGVEQEHSTLRLRYLLFPALWPAPSDQAVAQALFEIDTETGTIRHRLDALRRCDLSNGTRRAIRDSGGEI